MSTTLRCTQLPVRAQEGVREETGTRRDGVQSLQRYRVGYGDHVKATTTQMASQSSKLVRRLCWIRGATTRGVSRLGHSSLSITRVLEASTPSYSAHSHPWSRCTGSP